MAKTRFFQHLNENDPDFQKVTTLEYIDNNGDMNLFYFADGSKCSKDYIAPIGATTVKGMFEFAEVTSPHNIWKFKKVMPKKEGKPKTAVADNGKVYEAPSWAEYTGVQVSNTPRIDVLSSPTILENFVAPNDADYYYQNIQSGDAFNFNDNNSTPKEKEVVKTHENSQETNNCEIVEHVEDSQVSDILTLSAKKLMEKYNTVRIEVDENTYCELPIDEFITNATTPVEEKIIETEVIKEVIVKKDNDNIEIDIDQSQENLINNMIDMSKKEECSIDMEITLSLPPIDVYKIIKNVYQQGMNKGFVNIIANRMEVKELKTAVAEGLLAYYDDEYNSMDETNVVENNETPNVSKKQSRAKKA